MVNEILSSACTALSSLSDSTFSVVPRFLSRRGHHDYLPQFRFTNMTGILCSWLNAYTFLH